MTSGVAPREAELLAYEIEEVAMPRWKRRFDVVAAALGLLLLMPLYVLIAAAIVIESPGSPFYPHERVGKGGRRFTCWKFRSMRPGADRELARLREMNEAKGHIFKITRDPRRTRVGTVLRKTGLDEFPQLWNVLRGEMSLVGPRPPLPAEVDDYEPHHMPRLAGIPGITGFWQVKARERYDFEEMVRLDVEYLQDIRPWRDTWIMLATLPVMLFARGS